MNNQDPEQRLIDEIAFLRARVLRARSKLDAYDNGKNGFSDAYKKLDSAEGDLVNATREVHQPAANLDGVGTRVDAVRTTLSEIDQSLRKSAVGFQNYMAQWSVFVLLFSAVCSIVVYIKMPSLGNAWAPIRLLLLAGCGGMAGSGIVLSRILSRFGPGRSLDPRLTVWNLISPLVSAALSIVFVFIARMTPLAFIGTTASGSAPVQTFGVVSVFGLGILVGFAPDTVIYRIRAVIKALFGTDEVAPAQISKPQVVRVSPTDVIVTATITSSDVAQVASANVLVQVAAGEASFVMTRGDNNTWTADITLPQSNAQTPPNQSNGSLFVEALDSTGNLSRSNPVTLPPIGQVPTPGDITPSGGTVSDGDSTAELTIPPGAVTQNTAISITPLTDVSPPDTLGNLVPGTAYQVVPASLKFTVPAALKIKYDPASIPGGRPESVLRLYTVGPSGWQLVTDSPPDTTAKTVTVPISVAGSFAVFVSG